MKQLLPSLMIFTVFLTLTMTTNLFVFVTSHEDTSAMLALRDSFNPPGWSGPDPCNWANVACSDNERIIQIQLGNLGLQGTLPAAALQSLTELQNLELQSNKISGSLPSLDGALSNLRVFRASNNLFSSIPVDFFAGMLQLEVMELDNNPFQPWEIPRSLIHANALRNFSANSANIVGEVPDFLSPKAFPSLTLLQLAFNSLEGALPSSFYNLQLQSLWLNEQTSANKLSGTVGFLQNMNYLTEARLHSNAFTGPLPDFFSLKNLRVLSLSHNRLTGPVPASLVALQSLKVVNLTGNLFQGPMPAFGDGVEVDNYANGENSYCLKSPGECDPRVQVLLSVVGLMGYPQMFAESWKGNDPCTDWIGITCSGGNIVIINFHGMGLGGAISPEFANLKSLQHIMLADNHLTGSIPEELTTLPVLSQLNVENNLLHGKVPCFRNNVIVSTYGNVDMEKDSQLYCAKGTIDRSSFHVAPTVLAIIGIVFLVI